MFSNAITLPFKVLGIPIKLDASFALILPIFAWLIGSQVPSYLELFGLSGPVSNGLKTGMTPYFLGFLAASGLFLSVLIHELGHAVAARFYGTQTKAITLWFLGGVAQFDDLPKQRGAEAVVAIVGPITSLFLAGLFYGMLLGFTVNLATSFILIYLSITNVALAVFNLLPALPLDGGRVLRSLLKLQLGNVRATRISVFIGQGIALLLGLYGLFNLSFLLMIMAFFIFNAGRAEARHAQLSHNLENLHMDQVMMTNFERLDPGMSLAQLHQLQAFKKQAFYPVVTATNQLLGLVKSDLNYASHDSRPVTTVMEPAETIHEHTDMLQALKELSKSSTGHLIVVNDAEQMIGILNQQYLLTLAAKSLS